MKVEPTTKELIAMLYERCPEFFNRPQPAQECPNLKNCKGACFQCEYFNFATGEMNYPTAQPAQEPKREWVGLTEEDRWEIIYATERDERTTVMELVEAKLKEKNT